MSHRHLEIKRSLNWITGYFSGQDIFIVGSGPSLVGFDFGRLGGRKTIAINHAYKYLESDILVFNDKNFLREDNCRCMNHSNIVCSVSTGLLPVTHDSGRKISVFFSREKIPSDKPEDGLYKNRGSGLTALNLAQLSGAKRIFLLGYDYRFYSGSEAGRSSPQRGDSWSHFDNGLVQHYRSDPKDESRFTEVIKCFDAFNPANIFNLSLGSGLYQFPKVNMDDVL